MSWKTTSVGRLCALAAVGVACSSLAGGLKLNPPCNPTPVNPRSETPTNPTLPKRNPVVVCLPNNRPPSGKERAEFEKLREQYTSKGWKLECFSSTDGNGASVTKCVVKRPDGSVVFTGDPDFPFPPDATPNGDPPKPETVLTSPGGGNGNAQGGGAPSSKKQDEERDPWAGAGGTTCNPTVIATGAKINDEVDLVVALPGQNFELRRCFSPATPMMGYTAGLGWNLSVDSYVNKADIARNTDGSPASTRGVAYIGVYAVPQRDTTVFHNDRTAASAEGLAGEGKFYLPAGPGTTFMEEIDAFPIPTGVNGETTLMPVFRQVTFGGGATVYFNTKNLASPSLTPLQNEKYQRLHGMMAQQFDPFGNVWTYDYDEAKEYRKNSVTGLLEPLTGPRLRHVFLHGTHLGDAGMRARLDFDWDWGYYDESSYIWRTDMLRGVYVVRFVQDSGGPQREVITDAVVYTYVQDLLDLATGGNSEANRAAIRYLGTERCLAMATRQTLLNAEVRGQAAGVDDVEIHNRFSQYRYALADGSDALIGLKAIFYPEQFEYIAENAITNLQANGSLGELAGIGNLTQAAALELLQMDDSGDEIELVGDGLRTAKQLAGKWMEYDINKKLKFQIVRSGCGCGSGVREDYGVALASNSNKLAFPGGMAVWLPNYSRIVHERVCDEDGVPAAGPPLRTRIYRNEQRVIHRVAEFPNNNGPTQAPSGWVMMEWAPFTTAEAIFEYQNNGELPATVKKVWVTGYEYDASNRTIARRMSSSMLSGVTSIPTPSLPTGSEFTVVAANVSADSLDFLVEPTLVLVPEISGYSRIAYKASTGGMSELSTYRTIASETLNLDGQIQTWFGNTFGRMASLDIVERKTRAGTTEYVTEQKAFLPFSSWRPDLPTMQRRLTGVAASPKIESENSYQLEAFVGSDSVPFGPSSGGSTWRRIATVTTKTEGDGTEENGASNIAGNVNDVFSIQGFSTVGSAVWERQTNGRLDAHFHDETTGAETMRVNHVGLLFTIDGKPNIRATGPHGRALNFDAAKLTFSTGTDSLVTASIVDIMGRERRRTVNIPNSWLSSAGAETLVLVHGGHITDTRYGLDRGFARWYPQVSPDRWKAYVETQSGGFFASPTSTSFFQPPSSAAAVWLGSISRTYLDSAMNAVCEETRESNHVVAPGDVLSRTEYSLDLAGRVSATRKWWFAFSSGAAGDKFFTSRVERDALGRVRKVVDENGGVTETDYDAKDRAIETRTGASESAMGSSATFQTSRMLYDTSSASTVKGGDGLLDFTIQSLGVGQPDRVRRTLYDNLYRPVADVAVESLAAAQTPVGPWKLSVTDLAGRTIESGTASSELSVSAVGARLGTIGNALANGLDGLSHLNSHEKTYFSANRGLAYRSESAIVPGNWSAGTLRTDRWFDVAGNVLTLRSPASPMNLYWRDVHDRVLWEASSWPALTATNLNTVLAASIPAFQRKGYSYHSGTSLVSLTKTTSSSPDTLLPQVHSYIGNVYDPAGRPIATVNYGHGLHAIDTQSDPTIDQASQPLNAAATAPAVIPMPLSLSTSWSMDSYGSTAPDVPSGFLSANPGVVITRQSYNAMGLPQDSIDASGRITRTLYDALGRVVGSIENMGERTAAGSYHYISPEWFEASGSEPAHWGVNWSSFSSVTLGADSCRVTTSVLDGLGNTVLRVAFQRGETVAKQFTQFVYKIDETLGAFSSGGGGFGSSNLLYEIRYPDPVTGLPSTADDQRIRYRYNQAGEQTAVIDQNGTTRLFARDSQGRLLTDSVQLPLVSGSAVDATAATTRSTYDTSGRVLTTEMLNASSATLNKVTYEYDELGSVKALKQVAGYVGGGGSSALGDERIVRYDLKSYPWLASPSGVSGNYLNNWRGVMGVSYPYGTPVSATDDTELRYYPDADRVSELSSAATDAHHRFAIVQPKMVALRHAGAYAPSSGTSFTPTTVNPSGVKLVANVHRLGMGRTASMSLDVPQVHLDRVRSMTGKTKEGVYGGWDRFGRLKQQVWALTPTPAPTSDAEEEQRTQGWMQDTSSSPSYPEVRPVYQHAYSYSADSDRMSDDDLRPMAGGGSGGGGSAVAAPDRKYSYDNLRRLTKEEKGSWKWNNGSQTFASGAGSNAWLLDLLGNWKSIAVDTDGNGTFGTSETSIRTHDAQNQLTSLGEVSASNQPKYIRAYDKNGNLQTETKFGDDKPTRRFIYDAWNRLVRVERGLGGVGVAAVEPTPVATYTYNALNWRVTERVRWPGDAELSGGGGYTRTRVFFFSSDWQVLDALEDRHTPTTSSSISTFTPDSETQFVWGVRDKDELLEVRTRALTNSSGTVITPVIAWTDTAVNRVYALSDAQMSVAGYVNSSGRMREARVYDSYGRMTRCLPGDFNADGVCDDADFQVFNTSYDLMLCNAAGMPGSNAGPSGGGNAPTWGCVADLNGDWVVDETDFQIFAASYGQLLPELDTLVSGNASAGALEWGPGWNGYWFDPATGLWLSRNRWYDPEAGRWITRDPAGYVDGLSLYLYVKGNPFLFRDPSGLYSLSELGQIGAAFVAGVAHSAGRAAVGAVNMVAQTAAGVVDGAGLAADAAGTLAGYNMNYQPISTAGEAAVADTENWAGRVYDNADKLKNTVASFTVADTVLQTEAYVNGEMTDDEYSEAQGSTSATAALMATGARGRTRGSATVVEPPAEQPVPAKSTVSANKARGDAFRDQVAADLQSKGRDVKTEVSKKTPFGIRKIDIEVSHQGRVLGGVETKVGSARYSPWQRAKDAYLQVTQGYKVNMIRQIDKEKGNSSSCPN